MEIDVKLISRLEELARLELSLEERERLQKDLNNILKMVEKLEDLDTTGVEPLVYVSEEQNVLREDVVKNQVEKRKALMNAPDKNENFFKVPKVIKK
ncbi:MAG: Asp-tRNA(Asn)/Glu-tRNA(Gln) amidotransferase subunit GatC [Bacteroidetes bacterium]|nr:Asp-tRNA(Asn)/Glu-tRNA(Gln) amidotransferase subunit GatC [Bacteroidota bacterium]